MPVGDELRVVGDRSGGDVAHGGLRERRETPKTNVAYWSAKLGRNVARDERHVAALRANGWKVMTVWECDLSNPGLERRLSRFLDR